MEEGKYGSEGMIRCGGVYEGMRKFEGGSEEMWGGEGREGECGEGRWCI